MHEKTQKRRHIWLLSTAFHSLNHQLAMAIIAATVAAPLTRRATGAAVTALLAASVLAATSAPTALAMSTSSSASASAAAATVPSALSSHDFLSTSLQPITLGADPVTSLPVASVGDRVTAQDVLASQISAGGGAGAVAFVVRRPG